MPPVPSDEIMDARFATNQMLEVADLHQSKDVAIRISGAAYPVTISWNVGMYFYRIEAASVAGPTKSFS